MIFVEFSMFLFDVSRLLYANKYNYKPYIDSRLFLPTKELPLWPFAYSRQLILFMKILFSPAHEHWIDSNSLMIFGALIQAKNGQFCFLTKFYCLNIQEKFFSAPERAVFLTLKNNRHLIILFLSHYYLHRKSSLWLRYKTMNIETI